MKTDGMLIVYTAQAKLDRLLPKGNISFKLLWCVIKPGMIVKYTHTASGEAVSVPHMTRSHLAVAVSAC
jgi:hypothetical protein